MFNFCEIIKGGPNNRGNIVYIPKPNYELDYFGKEASDCYNSVFMHTEDYYKYDNKGTKIGYDGHVFSNYLYWDMDNANLEKARTDTVELVERLMVYNKSNIRIYFSGGKGFHVFYVSNHLSEYSNSKYISTWNDVVKSVCHMIADDLQSFDRKIYDKTRIIRTPNSKHPKTGLYKIPITFEELCGTVNDIRTLASKQRKLEYETLDDDSEFKQLIANNRDKKPVEVSTSGLFSGDELFEGIMNGFSDGNCHRGLVSVAGLLRSRDISNDIIYAILTNINAKSDNHATDAELNRIVEAIGRYPVKKEYVEPKDDDIVDIRQAGDTWKKIMTQYGYTSFGDRFPHINERMKTLIPGDTIAFVASSGVGKSTMGLELGNEEAKFQNKKSLFGSLEMSCGGVFFRTATIESYDIAQDGYVPTTDVANILLNHGDDLRERIYKQWGNLLIIDKGGLSLDKLIEYFHKAQEMTNGNVSNLVIDYFQNLDNVEKIDVFMETARRLKGVAKEIETKLFILLQTNKMLPDDYTEPQKIHIEGGGQAYQAMDYVIAAWKSRDYKNRLHAKFMKDRWSSPDYRFDLVREGLKYHTEDVLLDTPFSGGL